MPHATCSSLHLCDMNAAGLRMVPPNQAVSHTSYNINSYIKCEQRKVSG